MTWPIAAIIIAVIFAAAWVLRMVIVAAVALEPPQGDVKSELRVQGEKIAEAVTRIHGKDPKEEA